MRLLLWGGTGQAKVISAALAGTSHIVVLVVDMDRSVSSPLPGVPVVHDIGAVTDVIADVGIDGYCVTIGGSRGRTRMTVAATLDDLHLRPVTVVHPRAWVDDSATIGAGSQIMALAGVGVETRLGAHCIVNTAATIDHECLVGDGVHVMPGATVAGCVRIGDGATIGSNATILPRITIGPDSIVGAGAVVTRDVSAGERVVGVPARSAGS